MTEVPSRTIAIAAIFGLLGVGVSVFIFVDPAAVPMTAALVLFKLWPLVKLEMATARPQGI